MATYVHFYINLSTYCFIQPVSTVLKRRSV